MSDWKWSMVNSERDSSIQNPSFLEGFLKCLNVKKSLRLNVLNLASLREIILMIESQSKIAVEK